MQLLLYATPQRDKYLSTKETAVIRKVAAKQVTAEFVLFEEDMPIEVGAVASTHWMKTLRDITSEEKK